MEAITVSFVSTEEQVARVDDLAAAQDRNRSQMLRRLIDLGVKVLESQTIELSIDREQRLRCAIEEQDAEALGEEVARAAIAGTAEAVARALVKGREVPVDVCADADDEG